MNQDKPIGRFSCKAIMPHNVEECFGFAGEKNTEQIGLGIFITGEGPKKGDTVPWYGFLNTTENLDRTIRSLRLLGARCKDGDVTDLQGLGTREAFVDLVESNYNGKVAVKAAWITDGGAVITKKMDRSSIAEMAARSKAMFASKNGRSNDDVEGDDLPI